MASAASKLADVTDTNRYGRMGIPVTAKPLSLGGATDHIPQKADN